jgi:hypothetical protein
MDPVSSLLRSQYPAGSPYLQPAESIKISWPISLRSSWILTSCPRLDIQSSFPPSGFAIKILYVLLVSSMFAVCLVHFTLNLIFIIAEYIRYHTKIERT